jgi:hypothetical protein
LSTGAIRDSNAELIHSCGPLQNGSVPRGAHAVDHPERGGPAWRT